MTLGLWGKIHLQWKISLLQWLYLDILSDSICHPWNLEIVTTCQHICGKVKVKMRAKKYPKTQYSHYVFLFVMEFSTMRLVIKVIDTFICLYSVQIMQCIISSVMTTCVVWKHVRIYISMYHYTLNFKIFFKWLFVNVSIFGKFL